MEKALLCAVMREAKASKRRRQEADRAKQFEDELDLVARPKATSTRKITFKVMAEMAFQAESMRVIDIARTFKVHSRSVKRIWAFVARLYLMTQLQILQAVAKRAEQEKPDFVVTRVAWDETGERLTLSLPGAWDRPADRPAGRSSDRPTDRPTDRSVR